MTDLLNNIHFALPEMILLGTACLALLADIFLSHRYQPIVFMVAMLGLVCAGTFNFLFLGQDEDF